MSSRDEIIQQQREIMSTASANMHSEIATACAGLNEAARWRVEEQIREKYSAIIRGAAKTLNDCAHYRN